MDGHLAYRTVVCHYKTIKLPLITQDIFDKPLVGCGMLTVYKIERGHKRTSARLSSCLIRRKILIKHTQVGHIHRVIIASTLHCAIESIVLHTRHDIIWFGKISLVSAHHSFSYSATEVRIFTPTLCYTSPACIQCDVHHRRIHPVDACRRTFECSHTGATLNGIHIPRATQSQRDREHRLVSVDDIHAHDKRYSQATLLHSYLLQFLYLLCALDIKYTTKITLSHKGAKRTIKSTSSFYVTSRKQVELTYLLLQGHLRHQFIDESFHFVLRLRHHWQHERQKQ